jgi:hypothetical protein
MNDSSNLEYIPKLSDFGLACFSVLFLFVIFIYNAVI